MTESTIQPTIGRIVHWQQPCARTNTEGATPSTTCRRHTSPAPPS